MNMKHPSLLQFLLTEAMYNKLGDKLLETRLCQMAIDRAKYKERVENLIDQISQNAILVYIATHNKEYSQLLNHWKVELNAHIDSIRRLHIKNDSKEKRSKIIFQVIDELDLGTREDAITAGTHQKMKDEGIDIDSKKYKDAAQWLMNEYRSGSLVDVLTTDNVKDVYKYINKI